MPKQKTHKGTAKRIKLTGTGKVKRMSMGKSHILTKKNRKRKRRLRQAKIQQGQQAKLIKKLLPYS